LLSNEQHIIDIDVNLNRPLRLDAFLKIAGAAPTGGVAKQMIQSGDVQRNGEEETRRGAKLQDGDVIEVSQMGVFRVRNESENK